MAVCDTLTMYIYILESYATKIPKAPPGRRLSGDRRSPLHPLTSRPRHCEERSDVAIPILCQTATAMRCRGGAFPHKGPTSVFSFRERRKENPPSPERGHKGPSGEGLAKIFDFRLGWGVTPHPTSLSLGHPLPGEGTKAPPGRG